MKNRTWGHLDPTNLPGRNNLITFGQAIVAGNNLHAATFMPLIRDELPSRSLITIPELFGLYAARPRSI